LSAESSAFVAVAVDYIPDPDADSANSTEFTISKAKLSDFISWFDLDLDFHIDSVSPNFMV
jgi:hypothetical protein